MSERKFIDRELSDSVPDAIREVFTSDDHEMNFADALILASEKISKALDRLGNADAATPMGGMEAHGLAVKEAAEMISGALSELAGGIVEAGKEISQGLDRIAKVLNTVR